MMESEEEIETVLEKMWDLHDKLSDAILSVSRAHYHRSRSAANVSPRRNKANGFVFANVVPDTVDGDDVAEEYFEDAKSLNAIRAALEDLEDQLEFFHTVQMQQRAERDAAIARIEQSRIFLARRLSEHHGKKYKVIEEALAFIGETNHFVSSNYTYASCPPGEKSVTNRGISFNIIKMIVRSFGFAKNSLNINEVGGILGNAALVALSMVALLHLHQRGSKSNYMFALPLKKESNFCHRNAKRNYRSEDSSAGNLLAHLDVTLARG